MINKPENVTSPGRMARTTVQGAGLGEYNWHDFLPLAFGGHCFYCRQDATGDQIEGGDALDREIGGIVLPQFLADRCQFMTVLGIGPRVGMTPSKRHQIEYRRSDGCNIVSDVKVGDRLLVTQMLGEYSNQVKRSPWNWQDELFIEEGFPVAVVED